MKLLYNILVFMIGFGALIGVVFLVATTYGWSKIWEHKYGFSDMGPIQFEGFDKGNMTNQALVCPNGICKHDDNTSTSPIYSISLNELKSEFLKAMQSEEGLSRDDDGTDPHRMRFVQRSKMFRFPDTIRVQFFALGDDKSTIALHSQSQLGRSDFGVNKTRLQRWLGYLKGFETH